MSSLRSNYLSGNGESSRPRRPRASQSSFGAYRAKRVVRPPENVIDLSTDDTDDDEIQIVEPRVYNAPPAAREQQRSPSIEFINIRKITFDLTQDDDQPPIAGPSNVHINAHTERLIARESRGTQRARQPSVIDLRSPSPVPSSDASLDSDGSVSLQPLSPLISSPSRSHSSIPISQLDQLTISWNAAALKARAASIRFVNELDNTVPPGMMTFRYLEAELDIKVNIRKLASREVCVLGEDDTLCPSTRSRGCQVSSELKAKQIAYTHHSRFRVHENPHIMPDGRLVEVIECSEGCRCGEHCPNRVSQRPRTTPIEVYKTRLRGWGVRSPQPIQAGVVLGFFTGRIIKNPDGYVVHCFPLDFTGDPKYAVDASISGNWTRFINHSCAPNLQLYGAAVEFRPKTGLSRVVFTATKDIQPFEELTIDYAPNEDPSNFDDGALDCHCGTRVCRGKIFPNGFAEPEDHMDLAL